MNFAYILGQDDFSAGSRWLQRFKGRHDIVGKVITGESYTVDVDNVRKWVEVATFLMQMSGLFLANAAKPDSLCTSDSCHSGKLLKLRITMLSGCQFKLRY